MDLSFLKKQLEWALTQIEILKNLQKPMPTQTANGTRIYEVAKASLGTDASPSDFAPDYLGCAETVWQIVSKATGIKIGGQRIISTKILYEMLLKSPSFESVKESDALPGDIILSPTGYGKGTGHTGIVARQGVMSNSSETGRLELNYTIASWKQYFGGRGFPVVYFRCL